MELELVPYQQLKKKAAECPALLTPDAIEKVEAMVERMVQSKAVGISAPQVGIDQRFFIMNHTGRPEDRRLCINPHILDHGHEIVKSREGCINYPERIFFSLDRFAVIDVEYITITDEGFTHVKETLKRWPAIVFQHLMEYLDGEDNQVIKLLEERDNANKQENPSGERLPEMVKETQAETVPEIKNTNQKEN